MPMCPSRVKHLPLSPISENSSTSLNKYLEHHDITSIASCEEHEIFCSSALMTNWALWEWISVGYWRTKRKRMRNLLDLPRFPLAVAIRVPPVSHR